MDQDRVCVLDQVMCLSPQTSNSGPAEANISPFSYAISETLLFLNHPHVKVWNRSGAIK